MRERPCAAQPLRPLLGDEGAAGRQAAALQVTCVHPACSSVCSTWCAAWSLPRHDEDGGGVPRGGDGLVQSLAAGDLREMLAEHGLTGTGQAINGHHDVEVG